MKIRNLSKSLNIGLSRGLCVLFLTGLTGALVACGNSNPVNNSPEASWNETLKDSWNRIFSTRAQNRTHFIALYQLKSPALLAKLKDGEVDLDLKEAMDQEQTAFIAEAQKLSPEIRVLYKYRLVLNAVTLVAPVSAEKELSSLSSVQRIESSNAFARPEVIKTGLDTAEDLKMRNSVKFIGAEAAHSLGIRGQGMRVGIIDTGIDYTHSMLGGSGEDGIFFSIHPNLETPLFPNAKVVGGIDLVGTDYNSASDDFSLHLPNPDANPIDESGHGTHVAGTVAGLGDGEGTYSGVAPDATLYAIKVFGAEGSTSDEVVIAGLEYAADPLGNLDISQHLDVVNMSLGSPYGTSHIFYAEAIKNLSKAGTIVVASGGNSGANMHIVGAPGVSDEAISVAASVDNTDHNWKFRAVEFVSTASGEKFITEAVEAPIAKSIEDAGDVTGALVFAGLANQDFTPELLAALKGQIALIDRGGVTFAEKMLRAEDAGAVGVVVVNNQEGAPFAMGGDGNIKIPSIMISKALGAQLKAEMAKGEVLLNFQTDVRIEKPELIDTVTGFSSEGPRSYDSLIKPEITAPGMSIISAKMGGGHQGIGMSGTSMSAPHIAGVMALLKQAQPTLSSQDLKSLLMGTSITIKDENQNRYPVSRQGAGRVQVDRALNGVLVAEQASLSLGEVALDQQKILTRTLDLKNISERTLKLNIKFEGSKQLKFTAREFFLAPGATISQNLAFTLRAAGLEDLVNQVDGWIKLYEGENEVHRVPVLAMVRLVSQVRTQKLAVDSTSEADSFDSPAHLTLKNDSSQPAQVMLFNSLGFDGRKLGVADPLKSRACDLQAAGYRLIDGKLQIAIKTYQPLTTWNNCEVSIQLDMNQDGIADQELVGIPLDHLPGTTGSEIKSVLLDAKAAREIRKSYEEKVVAGDRSIKPDYLNAILGVDEMIVFNHATLAVVQMDLASLKTSPTGEFAVKIATTNVEDYAVEPDDFLRNNDKKWMKIDSTEYGQAYRNLPDLIKLNGHASSSVDFKKGYGTSDLLVIIPTNSTTFGSLQKDQQLFSVRPSYLVP